MTIFTAKLDAARKPGRETLERVRAISFAILVFIVFAGGALLLEHAGLFAGTFRTEILARVYNGDVTSAAEVQ
ncbi:hypothetical protein [Rhizobium etli]|uniref:hypothetical protein n=1 Tax=Rhizobium etli TaxID=29449 RepID=UPI0003FA6C1D|nr:hypothetical protein [Rhizobium etli]